MHTHFDDQDWQAARQRYKESTSIPKKYQISSLSSIRDEINATRKSPFQAGPSFKQILEQASIPNEILEQHHKEIINSYSDAIDLLQMIREKKSTVEVVVESHLRMAALAQQALGCYSEIYFEKARIRARQLDKDINNGVQVGRLAGLPVSIKAHLAVEGTGSDRGFIFDILNPQSAKRLLDEEEASGAKGIPQSTLRLMRIQGNHVQESDGVIASALLAEGAIIIAKTVMPQSVMQLDTNSNLHGQTLNPWNMHLSPGGSSGGESASIAAGATVFGYGSDIGGSIRGPASVTGLYGIRCTIGRIATGGTRSTMLGNEGIIGIGGPLCRSLRDLQLVTEVLITKTINCDPFLTPPIPFNKNLSIPTKVRVGVLYHDGHVLPITPIRRAMQHTVDNLAKDLSIELVYCRPSELYRKGWPLARELYFMDNGNLIKGLASITGEPLLPLTEFILSGPVRDHSASESWELQYTRESFKRQYWNEVWVKDKLDYLLCPAGHTCAPRFNSIRYWNYTSFFNLIDLPGVVFPIKDIIADSTKDIDFEAKERDRSAEIMSNDDKETRDEYENNREVYDGAPIGLQLIGKRFREEELLCAAKLIDDIVNKS